MLYIYSLSVNVINVITKTGVTNIGIIDLDHVPPPNVVSPGCPAWDKVEHEIVSLASYRSDIPFLLVGWKQRDTYQEHFLALWNYYWTALLELPNTAFQRMPINEEIMRQAIRLWQIDRELLGL